MNKSKQIFKTADHWGIPICACHAAQDYALQFSNPWRHISNGTPLLWVTYSKDDGGFIITPNTDFNPNPAWNYLVECEKTN